MKSKDIPKDIKDLVAGGNCHFSVHIQEALADYEFSEADLRCCVLQGRLHKRETDEKQDAVDSNKYVIYGRAVSGCPFYVCGKMMRDDEGRFFFFISAHERGQ